LGSPSADDDVDCGNGGANSDEFERLMTEQLTPFWVFGTGVITSKIERKKKEALQEE